MRDFEKEFNEYAKKKTDMKIGQLKNYEKVALYDFNGTLVSDMKENGGEGYARHLEEVMIPLRELRDEEFAKDLKDKGIEIKGEGIVEKLAGLVIEKVKNPKRGTKAKEAYYDYLEIAIERGEVKLEAFPEVFEKGNLIERDRKEGLEIISLSRGTDGILEKSMKVAKVGGIIERMYSTIPYGAEKTVKCYFEFFIDLLREDKLMVRGYEDEWDNVGNMFIADMALTVSLELKELPFEVWWIDRRSMNKEMEEKVEGIKKFYKMKAKEYGWRREFGELFFARNDLRD